MKTQSKTLKSNIAVFGSLAITSAFGQSSYVWTNQSPALLTAGDLNQGAKWNVNGILQVNFDAGGVPRPDFQDGVTWGDEMLFNGQTTGPLTVTQNGGSQANVAGSGQPYGLRIRLGSGQTAPVTIISPASVAISGGISRCEGHAGGIPSHRVRNLNLSY